MKTTISISDGDFEAAERVAGKLGPSGSELYANAVRESVARTERQGVTERLDALYGNGAVDSRLDPTLAKLQGMSSSQEDWLGG